MAFAIGFVALGAIMIFLSVAALSMFGLVIKVTFSWIWFVVVGICTVIILICAFITAPQEWFKKGRKKNVTVS